MSWQRDKGDVAARINELRRDKGLSIAALASITRQHPVKLHQTLVERRHPPRHDTVVELLHCLGVSVVTSTGASLSPLVIREVISDYGRKNGFARSDWQRIARVPQATAGRFLKGADAQWRIVELMMRTAGITLRWPQVSKKQRLKGRLEPKN